MHTRLYAYQAFLLAIAVRRFATENMWHCSQEAHPKEQTYSNPNAIPNPFRCVIFAQSFFFKQLKANPESHAIETCNCVSRHDKYYLVLNLFGLTYREFYVKIPLLFGQIYSTLHKLSKHTLPFRKRTLLSFR